MPEEIWAPMPGERQGQKKTVLLFLNPLPDYYQNVLNTIKKISTLLGIRKDEEKPGSSGINSFSPFEWALLIPRGLDQVMLAVGILNFYVHRQKEFWCRSSQGSCILIQSSRTTLNSQPQHPLSVQSLRAAGSVQDSLSCFSSLKAFNYLFFYYCEAVRRTCIFQKQFAFAVLAVRGNKYCSC